MTTSLLPPTSRRAIARAELGERIEIPHKQYAPYWAIAGLVLGFATQAPLVGLGFILLFAHSVLPTEVKPSNLSGKQLRMHNLLSEDCDDGIYLDSLVQDAVAIESELAVSIMEYIYNHASRDEDGDWIVEWNGQEILVCDFFRAAFKAHRENKSKKFGEIASTSAPTIGANTKLNAIPVAAEPHALGVPVKPPAIDTPTPATAPKPIAPPPPAIDKKQAVQEFKQWFKKYQQFISSDIPGGGTGFPTAMIQTLWIGDGKQLANYWVALRELEAQGVGEIRNGFYVATASNTDTHKGTEQSIKTPTLAIATEVKSKLQAIAMDWVEVDGFVNSFGDRKPAAKEEIKALHSSGQLEAQMQGKRRMIKFVGAK